MIRFGCPACKRLLEVPDSSANKKVLCSGCRQKLRVPRASRPSAPPTPNKTTLGISLDPQLPTASPVPARLPSATSRSGAKLAQPGLLRGLVRSVLALLFAGGVALTVLAACAVVAVGVWIWFKPADLVPSHAANVASLGDESVPDVDLAHEGAAPVLDSRKAAEEPVPVKPSTEPAPVKKTPEPVKLAKDEPKSSPPTVPVKLSGQQVYDRLLKSTVWVTQGTGWGTGVLVDAEEKLVITNHHVVADRGAPSGPVQNLQVINDRLAANDPVDPISKKRYKSYEFQFDEGAEYQLDMVSMKIDSYLKLVDPVGGVIAEDDDGGGFPNARIRVTAPSDGTYRVLAMSFNDELGEFKLTISRVVPAKGGGQAGRNPKSLITVNFPEFADGKLIVKKEHYVKLIMRDAEKYKVALVATSEAKDLALLKLQRLPEGVLPIPLARESGRPGEMVHSVGNPGSSGALWVYTSGTVRTAPYNKKWQSAGAGLFLNHDAVILETQSPTNPGDSGGPLVNDAAELVAITQGGSRGSNSINLFIDISEVRAFLEKHRPRAKH
jgi:S1-C subfamily serine protease